MGSEELAGVTLAANPLTARAKVQRSTYDADTMPASLIRVFVEALGSLGHDSGRLVTTAGLDRTALDDPDGRVPCGAVDTLLKTAQMQRPSPNLALRMASVTPVGAFPLLDYLVVTTDSVAGAFQALRRYSRLYAAPVSYDIRDDEDPVRVMIEAGGNPFATEYCISLIVLHMREETEDRLAIDSVAYTHQVDDPAEYEKILRCPVRSRTTWNGIAVPRQSWQVPMRRRDNILNNLLGQQAGEVPAGSDESGLALQVRGLIAGRIGRDDTRIAAVAREMATTPRTLQRRLAASSSSYEELLDRVRRETAERWLTRERLSISEISYLLGYSEAAAFHRAFKRWVGMTPQEFRRSAR